MTHLFFEELKNADFTILYSDGLGNNFLTNDEVEELNSIVGVPYDLTSSQVVVIE